MANKNKVEIIIDWKDNTKSALKSVTSNFKKLWEQIKWYSWSITSSLAWIASTVWAWSLLTSAQDNFSNLAIQTWKSWKELEDYKKIANDLVKTWLVENQAEAVEMIGQVWTSFWDSNEKIKETITSTAVLKRAFNWNADSIKALTQLTKNNNLSIEENSDLLLKSRQIWWSSMDDLIDSMDEYSFLIKDNWLDTKEFLNKLVFWANNWVYRTDKLWDSIKEAFIKLKDWTSKEALKWLWYTTAGINTLHKRLNNKEWLNVLKDLASQLLNITDKETRATLWAQIFWTQYEDIWDNGLKAISSNVDMLWDFKWATDEAAKAVKWNLSTAFKALTISISDSLEKSEALSWVIQWITTFLNWEWSWTLIVIIWWIIAALSVLSPLVTVVTWIMTAFWIAWWIAFWWIALAIVGVIAWLTAIIVYWDKIKWFFWKIWEFFWFWWKKTNDTKTDDTKSNLVSPNLSDYNLVLPTSSVVKSVWWWTKTTNNNVNNTITINWADKDKKQIANEVLSQLNRSLEKWQRWVA